MRVFAAVFVTECSDYCPQLITERDFAAGGMFKGDEGVAIDRAWPVIARWRYLAADQGDELVVGLCAFAEPGGRVGRSAYVTLKGVLLRRLGELGPFDLILLFLHGAMMAEGQDDCEGEILTEIREISDGKAVVGVVLDPHAHLSPAMVDHATFLIAAKHYPHDDFVRRGEEAYRLCRSVATRQTKPVPCVVDLPIVGLFPTGVDPMAGFVAEMIRAEQSVGILSVSFIHGFFDADTAHTGAKLLVYADGDLALACDTAWKLARRVYGIRAKITPCLWGLDEGLEYALRASGRVLIADTGDNPGGGAPGDNVEILRGLLRVGAQNAAFGCIYDPMVVDLCHQLGVGARAKLRIGGKSDARSGAPLDVEAAIVALVDNLQQSGLGGHPAPLGRAVQIQVHGVSVVLNTRRGQVFARSAFTNAGVDLDRICLLALKSSAHFRTDFEPWADEIINVVSPHTQGFNFKEMVFRKRDMNFYPHVNDPLGWE